jgi:uncharacterized UBP type Zn finger protein
MACEHMDMINVDVKPSSSGCEDCLKTGSWWVRLRMCLVCGYVGCCESSPNQHSRKHFEKTQHPIIQSFESGQDEMRWCYLDDEVV